MPTGTPLSLDQVHEAIWQEADRRGAVRLNQKDLAKKLGVNKFTMSRKVSELLAEGRIRQISTKGNARGIFHVTDPAEWVSR